MKNIITIFKLAKPLYKFFIILTGLIIVNAGFDLVTPIFSKLITDEIVNYINGTGGSLNRLYQLVAMSFVLSFLGIAFSSISDRLGDYTAGRVRQFLTEKYYDKVLKLSQVYFDSQLSGKIVHQLNRGIVAIQGFANVATNFFLPTVLQSLFTIILLAYYNVPIALLVTALFPIYIFLSYLSTKKWGQYEVEKNQLEDTTRGRIQEVINNIKVVKSFNQETDEYGFIKDKLTNINKIYDVQSNYYHIFDFLRNLSLIVVVVAINLIAFTQAFNGNISIGTLVLILQLVLQARRPLFAMSFILARIQEAESGSKEFLEVLQLTTTETAKDVQSSTLIHNPSLKFEKVTFAYDKESEVIKNMSFTLSPKETVALVGHSGAGKSTIISLLLKFYTPTSGEIFLSDKKYSKLDASDIRHHIGLVFQENELFSSTIAENIAYGNKASEKEIISALKKANAYDFVMKLPKGIQSEIGERGVKLSGGQKQRIQIARAILANRPILILDEATSSLDSYSEHLVQEALKVLMKDKLVIIIAHRLSTIQNVDRILVLDKGTIVDAGTPGELAKRPGIYNDLLKYQIEGDKKLLKDFEIY